MIWDEKQKNRAHDLRGADLPWQTDRRPRQSDRVYPSKAYENKKSELALYAGDRRFVDVARTVHRDVASKFAMNWEIERDDKGEPIRMVWLGRPIKVDVDKAQLEPEPFMPAMREWAKSHGLKFTLH